MKITSNPNRMVALLTPVVFAPLAGAISVLAAKYLPGVNIDQGSVEAIFIAGATIAFAKAALWLKGWQEYEKRTLAVAPGAVDPPSGLDAGGEIDLEPHPDDAAGDDVMGGGGDMGGDDDMGGGDDMGGDMGGGDDMGGDDELDLEVDPGDDVATDGEPVTPAQPQSGPGSMATAPHGVGTAVRERSGRVRGRSTNGHAAPSRATSARAARTFRLTSPVMAGTDVKAFQKALNVRFAAWGVHLQVVEDGVYGSNTRHAAHQAAVGLGLATSEYEHGITPTVRGLIRTPSRRSAEQLERAKGRRGWLGKLRKRHAGDAANGSASYPLSRHGSLIGTPHAGTHTLGDWQSDNAVDLGVPIGTKMIALDDGVVIKVRHHPMNVGRFAGDQITIRGDHGNGYFYAHGASSVQVGQRVQRGQSLGTTGSANGVAHLHFGVQHGDPRDVIGQRH